MSDDALNSVHLDLHRREAFRRARSAMLDACGDYTRMGQIAPLPSPPAPDVGTLEANANACLPPGLDFGLVDNQVVYPLKVGINTVGRMPDNDVVIEDPHISRRHCVIVVHSGSSDYEVHDVASKNGTFLNGSRLTGPALLRSGDGIRMCSRNFIFLSKFSRPDDRREATQP
jgi:hypothetical protein